MTPDVGPYPVGTYLQCPVCCCTSERCDPECLLCVFGWMGVNCEIDSTYVDMWMWTDENGNLAWTRTPGLGFNGVMVVADRFDVPLDILNLAK